MHLHVITPRRASPIEHLANRFRDHLYLPDPGALYVLMGSVAANMLDGPPVWLMLVGVPSSGKTELLSSLLEIPRIVRANSIASEAAFLSGTAARDRAKDAHGGLLRQVDQHGAIVVKDFTSLLSMHPNNLHSILAALRECYDGSWTRNIGAEGGRSLHWSGKLSVFAGVTPAIDLHSSINAELGERWIYWRYEDHDPFHEVLLSLRREQSGFQSQLQSLVAEFFDDLNLRFGHTFPRTPFTNAECLRLYRLATFAARCRSSVARDAYTREIVGARETEMGTRLANVLGQLLSGMKFIGVADGLCWRLLRKVALDSMPRLRKLVIERLAISVQTIEELQASVKCSLTVIRRTVEDLEMQDVIARHHDTVSLTSWARTSYRLSSYSSRSSMRY